jgi:hypothetical protein
VDLDVVGKANGRHGEVAKCPIKLPLDQKVTITVTLTRHGWWVNQGTHNAGRAEWTGRVRDLQGKGLECQPDDKSHTNTIFFNLNGLPKRPNMPKWSR